MNKICSTQKSTFSVEKSFFTPWDMKCTFSLRITTLPLFALFAVSLEIASPYYKCRKLRPDYEIVAMKFSISLVFDKLDNCMWNNIPVWQLTAPVAQLLNAHWHADLTLAARGSMPGHGKSETRFGLSLREQDTGGPFQRPLISLWGLINIQERVCVGRPVN